MNNTVGIILSAGKVHESLYPVFGEINSGLVPVKSKPAILYILQDYKRVGIKDVFISVGYDKERLKEIITASFATELNLHFVEVDYKSKPGLSLLEVFNNIQKKTGNCNTLITLSDTIAFYDFNKFTSKGSSVLVSEEIDLPGYWCTLDVDSNNKIKDFYEKTSVNASNIALTGVYYLENIEIFEKLKVQDFEISDLIKFYISEGNDVKAISADNWFDTGHLTKYYKAKKELVSARCFNFLKYNDVLGTIRKESLNAAKLRSEILWYENIPKGLKALIPKILDFSLEENVFVEMEYYGYPTLAELWLYGNLSEQIWMNILERLSQIIDLFKSNKGNVSFNSYTEVYVDKTVQRINEIEHTNSKIARLINEEYLIINGKKYLGWKFFADKIDALLNDFYSEDDNNVIHGDLCFSNILFDLNNGIIRLIDPRGSWGENLIYGDIKYDLAKLRHSICGKYDFIVNDLFSCQIKSNNIHLDFRLNTSIHDKVAVIFDEIISRNYDINKIKFIEGLLFISMIPLHRDNLNRQTAMFARSIQILNEAVNYAEVR